MDTEDIMIKNHGPQSGAETVYGTEDNNMVMSEKNEQVVNIVQQLAGSIYQEFERMINRYDEDVVKNLMPLLVNVLECLDASYRINQEQDVEVELLREDNEQLVTQYEREKSARKQAEQKLLESEDLAEQENKELVSRLESLESIVRMLELKHKNSLEHASRLEERESEMKKEYNKLHERYTELFKNHVDYMERTKILMGSTHSQMSTTSERIDVNRARLNPISRSSGPVSYGFASLENSVMLDTETICSVNSNSDESGPPSLQNEFDNLETVDRAAETNAIQQQNQATSPQSDTSPVVPNPNQLSTAGRSTTKKEQRSANTLYQELSFQDNDESEEQEVVTGSWVHPGEYASSANDNYFGMGKEVENLIMENNELLATKNALNIVKDDLIVKVDELTGEIEILREELNAMQQSRVKLRQKVSELEEELKKTKEQVKQQTDNDQDENDVPLVQRKRFTRVEMAMVLMERNQYKERLMELQEAVRLAEIIRASRTVDNLDKKSKQSIWKYFSSLFTPSNRPQERVSDGQGGGPLFRYSSPVHGSPSRSGDNRVSLSGRDSSAGSSSGNALHGPGNAIMLSKDYIEDGTSERASARRRETYRQLRAHVPKEDGRLHAYGWSLPINNKTSQEQQSKHSGGVPVPVYCNPLTEASPHMKVFCAAGVNLNGGFTKDGHSVIPADSPYAPHSTAKIAEITSPTAEHSAEALDRQISRASLENLEPETQLSSFVWICTSTHGASTVTVVDANQSATVLDAFPVCSSHLLCIASVQGAMEKDYALLENSEVIKSGEMLQRPGEGVDSFGKVEFVRVTTNGGNNVEQMAQSAEQAQEAMPQTEEDNNELLQQQTDGVEENAKEATEKTTDDRNTEPLGNVNEIKVRQGLPGMPQRISTNNNNNNNNNNVETQNENNNNNNNHTTNQQKQLPFTKPINPIMGTKDREEPIMSTLGPTMWMGAQDGWLYVHSSVSSWHHCLHKVQLPDSVLSIVHVESRVIVALACAQIAVFHRQADGQWDMNSYHLVTLGERSKAIRCLCVAGERVWAAYLNKIFILDPISLNIIHSWEAHPRKESQIRLMAATGAGVWVSIRLDSTLRLHNTYTFEHKQDVDIEPYVSKMLGTGKLGFSLVRITALMVSCNRLWIGTSNGVIISVPLTEGAIKSSGSTTTSNKQLPLCCMANAQLSFHGHRDAVKFFVSVPMQPQNNMQLQFANKRPDMLVMCGGEGYIDFRINDTDMENSIHLEPNQTIENRGDKSYLIVWHVSQR